MYKGGERTELHSGDGSGPSSSHLGLNVSVLDVRLIRRTA